MPNPHSRMLGTSQLVHLRSGVPGGVTGGVGPFPLALLSPTSFTSSFMEALGSTLTSLKKKMKSHFDTGVI